MFSQCPAIGANTGCGALITINPGGAFTITLDPSQGPYDGAEDALIGVFNNSGGSVGSLTLNTPGLDAFGFDGDGICTYSFVGNGYCSSKTLAPTGYEGPMTTFLNINSTFTAGTMVFAGGLANGASTYFSLEETPAAIVGSNPGGGTTPTSAPEPSTVALVGAGMLALGGAARRTRA